MRITRSFLVLLVMTALAAGCAEREETRAFPLETLSTASAARMIAPFVGGDSARVGTSGNTYGRVARVITVRGTPAELDAVAAFLAEHDQPGVTATLRFQVIEANGFEGTDPAIADVEAALQDVLTYDGYRLVAESIVRSAPGASFSQALGGAMEISGRIEGLNVREGQSALSIYVWLKDFGDTLLSTSATVPAGQVVVLGNARRGTDGPTYILVVRPTLE